MANHLLHDDNFYIGTALVKFPMKKNLGEKCRREMFDWKLPMCQCTYQKTIYGPHSIALCCMGSGKKFGTKWLCYCPLIISIMQLFGDFETTLKLSLHRSNWQKCDFILRFIFPQILMNVSIKTFKSHLVSRTSCPLTILIPRRYGWNGWTLKSHYILPFATKCEC